MSDEPPYDRGYEPPGYPVPRSEQPPRPPSSGSRLGRVTGVELRQESARLAGGSNSSWQLTVLAFRLMEPGNPRPLDVLLRGRFLSGTVRDGDWVEVAGQPNALGRYDVERVANLTTASTVVASGARPSKAGRVVGIAVLCFILVVFVIIVVTMIGLATSG